MPKKVVKNTRKEYADLREEAFNLYLKGENKSAISKKLNVARLTVTRWAAEGDWDKAKPVEPHASQVEAEMLQANPEALYQFQEARRAYDRIIEQTKEFERHQMISKAITSTVARAIGDITKTKEPVRFHHQLESLTRTFKMSVEIFRMIHGLATEHAVMDLKGLSTGIQTLDDETLRVMADYEENMQRFKSRMQIAGQLMGATD